MALLSMRADKFWKRTGKKISIQGSDVAGFDKSKVECFNCHKMGHFARKCRAPKTRLLKSSKDLESLIESQRSDKIKDGVRYNVVPPSDADLYLSPKKDLSWTGLPKFADNIVTDYSRPAPTVESISEEGQNKNSSTSEGVAITPKPFVKFVKPKDCQSESKPNKKETPKKPPVKYAEIKMAHSYVNRSFQRTSAVRPQYRAPWVPTVNKNFPSANRKLPT
nr:ribonuclease H-like domain-containing protein [Tanacetum cinerariifolium]